MDKDTAVHMSKCFSFWGLSPYPLPGLCSGPHWGLSSPRSRTYFRPQLRLSSTGWM